MLHITPANVHDVRAMDMIQYEENSFYIFDRGYNDFARLYRIHTIGVYLVIWGRTVNDFKPMSWKRRFPKDSGVLSDASGYMNGQFTMAKYPDRIRRIRYWERTTQES